MWGIGVNGNKDMVIKVEGLYSIQCLPLHNDTLRRSISEVYPIKSCRSKSLLNLN